MGTNTQAAGVYSPRANMYISLGMASFDEKSKRKDCNHYTMRGVKHTCNSEPGAGGKVYAYNATSGRLLWTTDTPEPPAGASVPLLSTNLKGHLRIALTLGQNCKYNSKSWLWALSPEHGRPTWRKEGPTLWSPHCAGDKEGQDIRRAMGGRAACMPNSMTPPTVDSEGNVYVGTQVGLLEKWGSPTGRTKDVELLSTLQTTAAFTDNGIAFGPGIMAVSTCTSLIILQTDAAAISPPGESPRLSPR